MRVHIATDHAAFELKQHLVVELQADGFDVVDHGAGTLDPADDYPPLMIACAEAVVADPGSLGIVLGGSGNGEQIAANKVPGVRAALAYNVDTARLAREHNDANVVALGGRMQSLEEGHAIVRAFLDTPFSNGERHARRIAMIAEYENGGRAAAEVLEDR
ncbi:ribose-5-phosphate isomerase [Tessaracoccus sp. HDW20]|uniref:ribose-5-phosphate isomerase n=1 Tax=Tessaracoccus coleopterorum TaxID=2714950 RepID=UPI0018D3E80D|nr:ribose-5-phosphate isomerase [Tessaracoccus coleopterorum]NHB85761.1 ribose-5-phosphate isomerase [Tessaracoccus coleopterorum]